MHRKIVALLTAAICITACGKQNQATMEKKHAFTNHLIHETSPYLLQHAHNPVNWHPWNEETLELARKENKLLLISVGYAACHWCHVMERESFEDPDVAAVMNAHFINVKVDREERPDVDQVYMNAVQLLTGRGGWPLNCVALPDGRPIWGGTYFPKKNWVNALQQLAALYREEPEKATEYAEKLTQGIHQSGLVTLNEEPPSFTRGELELSVRNWSPGMDLNNGGRKGAPKFMMPVNLAFLMRYGVQGRDQGILEYVDTSLTKMALGGIFDQVGGGFARYSVDDHWHIPHFEKMLYDNAQLLSLYAEAYQLTSDPLYKQVVYETAAFVERELYNGNGAFYSSLDADSENESGELEEGAFYVWTEQELRSLLAEDFDLFARYYNINAYGKWEEDKYHLIRSLTDPTFCEENRIEEALLAEKTTEWKKLLLHAREKRVRPRLDDKTLTSWNALMMKGYVDAYRVFQDLDFLKMALRNAHFIQNNMVQEDGGLYRNHKAGKSNISAYLEDYATVIDAYIALYEVTLDENWLLSAKQFADYCFDHFYDDSSRMFFFTSDKDAGLITRKVETEDNVIPSSNSIMAKNLFLLGHYFDNSHYKQAAETMLNNVKSNALRYGGGAANWLDLYANYVGDFYEIAIVGKDAEKKLRELHGHYLPNSLIVGSAGKSGLPLLQHKYNERETTIYVCIEGTCKLPVQETTEALKQLHTSFEQAK